MKNFLNIDNKFLVKINDITYLEKYTYQDTSGISKYGICVHLERSEPIILKYSFQDDRDKVYNQCQCDLTLSWFNKLCLKLFNH